jgi:hypothetical protein
MILRIEVPDGNISGNHCHTHCRFLTAIPIDSPTMVKCSIFNIMLNPDCFLANNHGIEYFRCEECHKREEG